jgi:hypothetical protein
MGTIMIWENPNFTGRSGPVFVTHVTSGGFIEVIEVLKQRDWHDFGPTFASEQLPKRQGIVVSDDETLRG